MEGQRQLNARVGRLDDQLNSRIDRVEAKVDKLIWLGMGLLGTTLATLVTSLVRPLGN